MGAVHHFEVLGIVVVFGLVRLVTPGTDAAVVRIVVSAVLELTPPDTKTAAWVRVSVTPHQLLEPYLGIAETHAVLAAADRDDISRVVLAARHEGVDVDHIESFPCFVLIALPPVGSEDPQTPLRADQLEVIGWGELYRTAADAADHEFD